MAEPTIDAGKDASPAASNIVATGPLPTGSPFPRWILRADVPDRKLPPVPHYDCPRLTTPEIDGDVDAKPWRWSQPFRHMGTGATVEHSSRVAVAWDSDYLYVAFDLVDPARQAISRVHGTHVYLYDSDAEILVAGPRGYYEIGVNSIGTRYEIAWTFIEPLVAKRSYAEIDRLFRVPNFLYFAPQSGERVGRIGDLDFAMPGLVYATRWSDRRGSPGWTCEFSLPWLSLAAVLGLSPTPRPGDLLQLQAFRAHHPPSTPHQIKVAVDAHGTGASPFEGWTWSTQGNGNVHNLGRWPLLRLTGAARRGATADP